MIPMIFPLSVECMGFKTTHPIVAAKVACTRQPVQRSCCGCRTKKWWVKTDPAGCDFTQASHASGCPTTRYMTQTMTHRTSPAPEFEEEFVTGLKAIF